MSEAPEAGVRAAAAWEWLPRALADAGLPAAFTWAALSEFLVLTWVEIDLGDGWTARLDGPESGLSEDGRGDLRLSIAAPQAVPSPPEGWSVSWFLPDLPADRALAR